MLKKLGCAGALAAVALATPIKADEAAARQLYTQAEAALKQADFTDAWRKGREAERTLGYSNALLKSVLLRAAFYMGDFEYAARYGQEFRSNRPNESLLRRFGPLADEAQYQRDLRDRGKRRVAAAAIKEERSLPGDRNKRGKTMVFKVARQLGKHQGTSVFTLPLTGSSQFLGWHRHLIDYATLPGDTLIAMTRKESRRKNPLRLEAFGREGKRLWSRELPNSKWARPASVTALSDGGLLAIYRPRTKENKHRVQTTNMVVKVSSSGKTEWTAYFRRAAGIYSDTLTVIPQRVGSFTVFATGKKEAGKTPYIRRDYSSQGALIHEQLGPDLPCNLLDAVILDNLDMVCTAVDSFPRLDGKGMWRKPVIVTANRDGTIKAQAELPVPDLFYARPYGMEQLSNGNFIVALDMHRVHKGPDRDRYNRSAIYEMSPRLEIVSVYEILGRSSELLDVKFSGSDTLAVNLLTDGKRNIHLIRYTAK